MEFKNRQEQYNENKKKIVLHAQKSVILSWKTHSVSMKFQRRRTVYQLVVEVEICIIYDIYKATSLDICIDLRF